MELFGLILVFINAILVIIITRKINLLLELKQEFRKIEINMTELTRENSRLVEVILSELETKIEYIKTGYEFEQNNSVIINMEDYIEDNTEIYNEINNEEAAVFEEAIYNHYSDIIDLRNQGLSVQEIASRIGISQGEIKLKLNLSEKSK